MGGLMGMFLAAKPLSPIRRLVLNDVGPMVPWRGLARLKAPTPRWSGASPASGRWSGRCARPTPILARSPMCSGGRSSVTACGARTDGTYALGYDPAIVHSLGANSTAGLQFGCNFLTGVDLWPMWDEVRCPTLVLRGARSDLLLASTATDMARRGPRAEVVELEGVGHAPWLKSADQIGIVREFLLSEDSGRMSAGAQVRAA